MIDAAEWLEQVGTSSVDAVAVLGALRASGEPVHTLPSHMFSGYDAHWAARRLLAQGTSASPLTFTVADPDWWHEGASSVNVRMWKGKLAFQVKAVAQTGVRVTHRNAVCRFLEHHPAVEGIIRDSQPALARLFGEPLHIILERIRYPEEQSSDELVAWIQSDLPVDEALDRLDRFEDWWFVAHQDATASRFNFNVETL